MINPNPYQTFDKAFISEFKKRSFFHRFCKVPNKDKPTE